MISKVELRSDKKNIYIKVELRSDKINIVTVGKAFSSAPVRKKADTNAL